MSDKSNRILNRKVHGKVKKVFKKNEKLLKQATNDMITMFLNQIYKQCAGEMKYEIKNVGIRFNHSTFGLWL